ncbi:MAG: LON peptidase substrate-binding domain-containing protein, partial [Chlamydiales bacterium]
MDGGVLKEDESNLSSPSDPNELENQSEESAKSSLHFSSNLPLIPLTRRPFFPGMLIPLLIEPGPFYESLKRVVKDKAKILGLVLTKKENANLQKITIKDLYPIGVAARIVRINPIEGGSAQVTLNIEKRFKIIRTVPKSKYLQARVLYHNDTARNKPSKVIKAYIVNVISILKELLKLNPLFKEELQAFLHHSDFTEPGKLADFSVSLTTASRDELQKVLSAFNLEARIKKALELLKKELDLAKLQNTIYHQLETTAVKMSNQALLQEQLKIIKKKLGIDKDDKSSDVEKFQKRLSTRTVPVDVMNVIEEELDKLRTLEMQSAEYSVCRNYLEWLTIVPWGILSQEKYNLTYSAKILEQDHYGLKDIKSRMLEFISVGKLSGGMKGSIICFVGPPGVGKTSIGKSIAKAINRKFYRFSVGGMRDEAEIKGHRRTYVGSMPGKIVQALKFTQTMNPIIMLDEVDKLGSNFQGDPASALLEVLDPEQNKDFLDHYLDVRCDLSHILFLVTSNVLDTIPAPLRDRMDILRLSGYVKEEKLHI